MRLYRITKREYINDLSGRGAKLHGGRWNNIGTALLYTASTQSLAVLETLVHQNIPVLSPDLALAIIEFPNPILIQVIEKVELPADWDTFPAPEYLAAIGDSWVHQSASAVLKVPSVISPHDYNYLVNPNHSSAKRMIIHSVEDFAFDQRLINRLQG